jgi:hypothetical protein
MLYVEMVCISLPVSRSYVRTSLSQTVCITTSGLSDKEMTMRSQRLELHTYVLGRHESADVLKSRTFRPNVQWPHRLSPNENPKYLKF